MCALFAGVRPAALSATLLELHTKRYTQLYLRREHRLKRDREFNPDLEVEMYSSFSDKSKYAGLVPTGKYLSTVYKLYHASIKGHLDKEVKKRGARRLHWDASYKEAKHLARYHGHAVFRALITATNEVGEIRIQFHVVTDGHDQMTRAIANFIETSNQ